MLKALEPPALEADGAKAAAEPATMAAMASFMLSVYSERKWTDGQRALLERICCVFCLQVEQEDMQYFPTWSLVYVHPMQQRFSQHQDHFAGYDLFSSNGVRRLPVVLKGFHLWLL